MNPAVTAVAAAAFPTLATAVLSPVVTAVAAAAIPTLATAVLGPAVTAVAAVAIPTPGNCRAESVPSTLAATHCLHINIGTKCVREYNTVMIEHAKAVAMSTADCLYSYSGDTKAKLKMIRQS